MKTSNLITALALGAVAYGLPAADHPANKDLMPAGPDTWTLAPADSVSLGNLASIDLSNIQSAADNVNVEERGLSPKTVPGRVFHPAWLPKVRPAAQAVTIAGQALLMTAWIDAQNRLCIILDAAFPGPHGTIIAGVQNMSNKLAILPHVFKLGELYAAADNGAEIEPADDWRWFWWA